MNPTPASYYQAYGLTIESPWPLPELQTSTETSQADVRFSLGSIEHRPEVDKDGNGFDWKNGKAYYHRLDVGCFEISDGREIVVDLADSAEDLSRRLSMLGPAMGLILMQRGLHLLHGSALDVNGEGVAFVGTHGAGKSTMAATLQKRGHTLITDDVLAMEFIDGQPRLIPSYAQIKLWPDSTEHFGLGGDKLPTLHPKFDKRALRDHDAFASQTTPLKRIYVLGQGDRPEIREVPALQAYPLLMQNWYGQRFGSHYFENLDQQALLKSTSALARATRLQILLRPRDFGKLDQVAELVEKDLEHA